jgi:hypothetical protein
MRTHPSIAQRLCWIVLSISLALLFAERTLALPVELHFHWDSVAPDVPADPDTGSDGNYHLNDDWASVPNGIFFVALDDGLVPLVVMSASGTGSGLATGLTGLGVDDSMIDAGEAIDLTFDVPVFVKAIETSMFAGMDAVFYTANSGANVGIESGLFSDDGDFATSFLLPASSPLRIGSVNGSFELQKLTVETVPEPVSNAGVLLASLAIVAVCRRRRMRS